MKSDLDQKTDLNPIGNERLTAAVGLLVLIPVAIELVSIVLGVHSFMSLHVFVGLALMPAVVLKLASTGWRFARYYSRSHPYLAQGPPQIMMRMVAPLFVVATIVLFGSGVAMGLLRGNALQITRRLHGPASAVWLVLLGLHVLVYLRRAVQRTAEDARSAQRTLVRGRPARVYALAAVLIGGLVLGAATVPLQHRWVGLQRHHRHRESVHDRAPASVQACRWTVELPPYGAAITNSVGSSRALLRPPSARAVRSNRETPSCAPERSFPS